MEKEQMSTPEPAMAVKMPPTKPVRMRAMAFQTLKFWIWS